AHPPRGGQASYRGGVTTMFKTIVLAVDGSKHAMKAAAAAIDLATEQGSKLHALTVRYGRSASVDEELRRFMEIEHLPQVREDMVEDESSKLLRFVREKASDKGVKKIETVIRTGDPGRTIADYAREVGADLVVMGSRGLGDVGGLLLGS